MTFLEITYTTKEYELYSINFTFKITLLNRQIV